MKKLLLSLFCISTLTASAQDRMTPETLWSLKRVFAEGLSTSGKTLYYSIKLVDWKTEKSTTAHYRMSIGENTADEQKSQQGKTVVQRSGNTWYAQGDDNKLYRSGDKGQSWSAMYDGLDGAGEIKVSPDGRYIAFSKEVLIKEMGRH